MNKIGLSIIIYSSDAYKDCWNPFFDLFYKNFSTDHSAEVLLLTNSLDYTHNNIDINVIKCGNETAWSDRLKKGLQKAKNELVFLIGDDFFLLNKMGRQKFDQYVDLINCADQIDHIRLLYKSGKFKTSKSKFKDLDLIEPYTRYRFLFAPSLWKRTTLLKYLSGSESPFMAEKMGTYRSWIYNDGFYCISKAYLNNHRRLYDCGSSGVIVKGKWAPWSVERLKKTKLNIDFELRGVRSEEEKQEAMNQARLKQLKDPIATLKSYISIAQLVLSRSFKKLKSL